MYCPAFGFTSLSPAKYVANYFYLGIAPEHSPEEKCKYIALPGLKLRHGQNGEAWKKILNKIEEVESKSHCQSLFCGSMNSGIISNRNVHSAVHSERRCISTIEKESDTSDCRLGMGGEITVFRNVLRISNGYSHKPINKTNLNEFSFIL